MNSSFVNKQVLVLGAICVLTFLCFRYTMQNQFTNWDDDFYVTNDPYIKALTPENLKVIFTEDITKNNYHPLCMLSLAINYHFSRLNPQAYYLTNILIHIANIVLVFFLLMQLCVRLKMNDDSKLFIAGFGALWFGVHPMHVESVAWIAERKDVLYAFFYFLGLLSYLKYLSTNKWAWYGATLLLFIASCLSKPMAVVFPVTLLCLDFLLQRPWSKKLITEKLVFFLISLLCGSMAFYTQNKTGAIASFGTLTLAERIMFAAYGYVMYIVKIFDPTWLSTFYPYPYRIITPGVTIGPGHYPIIYYLAPLLAIASFTVPLYLTYKRNPAWFRIIAFGFGYFIANVIFILQFVSVGAAIMADRYSYVAYVGLFFMIAYFLNELTKRLPSFKTAIIVILLFVSGILAYLCHERTYAWHDSETLLSDAIEKYPNQALLSYKWRGNYYLDQGDLDDALKDYNVLSLLRAADAKVYDRIGVIYTLKKDYNKAIEAFSSSLGVQNNVYKTYLDRSMLYSILGDTVNAQKDFITAYQLNPNSEIVMGDSSFNFVQTKKYDLAIRNYNMLLRVNNANPFYYFYRGVAEFGENRTDAAIKDWLVGIQFKSKDVLQSASYDLSVAYDGMGEDSLAVHYAEMAQAVGYKVAPDFMATLKAKKAEQMKK